MQPIFASFSASISELKKNPSALLSQADGEVIAILNHNLPTAYLVPAAQYAQMLERLEDYELGKILRERQEEKPLAITVALDDL